MLHQLVVNFIYHWVMGKRNVIDDEDHTRGNVNISGTERSTWNEYVYGGMLTVKSQGQRNISDSGMADSEEGLVHFTKVLSDQNLPHNF